jgi:hypothetical protein
MSARKRVNSAEFGTATVSRIGQRAELLAAINPEGKLSVREDGYALGLARDLERDGLVTIAEPRQTVARWQRAGDGTRIPIHEPLWDVSLTEAGKAARERLAAGGTLALVKAAGEDDGPADIRAGA